MSVTFYPAVVDEHGSRPLLRCACPDDIEAAVADPCAACRAQVNMANANAAAVLEWLGLPVSPALAGSIRASALLALCEAGAPLPEEDRGTPDVVRSERARVCGRPPGYLARRVAELRTIATIARDHWVGWG